MKNALFFVVTFVFASPMFAATPVFGNPAFNLDLAKKTIAPYLPEAKLLSISSALRSKFTGSGDGSCNPTAWVFSFGGTGLRANGQVSVFEEAYATFENGVEKIKCMPSTHFIVKDGYPTDQGNDLEKFLTQVIPMDQVVATLLQNGFSEVKSVSLSRFMGPNVNGPLYYFSAVDKDGKDALVVVDALTGKVRPQ